VLYISKTLSYRPTGDILYPSKIIKISRLARDNELTRTRYASK